LSSPFNIYSDNSRIAEYRIQQSGLGFDLGYAINSKSEVRVGQGFLWYRTKKVITNDPFPDVTERDGVTNLRYRYYGVDNVELPRSGFAADFITNRFQRVEGLTNFTQSELRLRYFQPTSKNGSIIFTASGGTSYSASTLDVLLQGYSLGGPFKVGAYGQNELLGNQYFLFQTGYEHKLMSFSPLMGEGLYVMGLGELGKVYDSPTSSVSLAADGSVALVARTALGPMFLGASVGNAGHRRWWFGMGRIF
jgi:NTE family protein